ncbi:MULTISPECIES: hypothetical protein [Paenibacillus]|uniref:ABC transmembrane type-1 domain-containing protein n=1 Tax=Paenibacillus borealis TaxID=160799 RepID=A0ABX3GV51_PAEBO|nr:hypothetical protein [Paenibacillus borealis]OMD35935.1 hypothetical protein BSK56_32560 [Paenibacillus borealis]
MKQTRHSGDQQQSREQHFISLRIMFKEMFLHTRTQWVLLMLGAVTVIAISILEFMIPQLTKEIIDQIIPEKRYYALLETGGLILLAALLLGIFNFSSSYVMTIVSQKAILQLLERLWSWEIMKTYSAEMGDTRNYTRCNFQQNLTSNKFYN